MREYRRRSDGAVIQDNDFRSLHSETAWPEMIDDASLDAFGYDPILEGAKPEVGPAQRLRIIGVVQNGEGWWVYSWAIDQIPEVELIAIKTTKQGLIRDSILAERDMRNAGGVMLVIDNRYLWFKTDDASKTRYAQLDSKATRANNLPDKILAQWETMNGSIIQMSVAILRFVIDAYLDNELALEDIAETHRQNMLAEEDPNAYNWRVGWPQTYAEWAAEQQSST